MEKILYIIVIWKYFRRLKTLPIPLSEYQTVSVRIMFDSRRRFYGIVRLVWSNSRYSYLYIHSSFRSYCNTAVDCFTYCNRRNAIIVCNEYDIFMVSVLFFFAMNHKQTPLYLHLLIITNYWKTEKRVFMKIIL